jgi:hypothetical protein
MKNISKDISSRPCVKRRFHCVSPQHGIRSAIPRPDGDVSFRPLSVEGFKIISVFVHGYCSCLHPRQKCRSQWPRCLRFGSAAARLLGLRLRIPPGTWMSLVKRSPTECGVSECDREASTMRRPWSTRGCCAMNKKSPSIKNNTKVSRYAVAKSYFVSLNDVTFVFTPIHQHV